MNVRDVLVRALEAVDEAQVPADLRSVAFEKAVDLLTVGAADPIQPLEKVRRNGVGNVQITTDASPLEKIAARLSLDVGVVQDVYDYDEGGARVIVSSKKLDRGFGPGTKQLALLVAAGRQATGDDEDWTSVDAIRKACEDYGKLDPSNFATHIKAMKNEFSFKLNSAQKREVKLTRPGWEAAGELVEKLAGGEG
jgi:hypothetical protein